MKKKKKKTPVTKYTPPATMQNITALHRNDSETLNICQYLIATYPATFSCFCTKYDLNTEMYFPNSEYRST